MEYYHQEKFRIEADLALRIGRIARQYNNLNLPESESYDVTLNLCLLQALLSQCTELMKKMDRTGSADFGLHSPINEVCWGLEDLAPDLDDYSGTLTIARLVKNLRNAMCHPTDFNPNAGTPSTGYNTIPDGSGMIQNVVFCNSPDVNRSMRERIHSARVFMVTLTPPQLYSLVIKLSNLLAQPTKENWDGKTITDLIAA